MVIETTGIRPSTTGASAPSGPERIEREGSSRGLIFGFALGSVMQMLQLERASCLLSVCSGRDKGRIFMVEGEVADADAEPDRGEEALYRILAWPRQRVEMLDLESTVEHRITAPLAFLLMEAARRQDERTTSPAMTADESAVVLPEWMGNRDRLDEAWSRVGAEEASPPMGDAPSVAATAGERAASGGWFPELEDVTADLAERLAKSGPTSRPLLQALVDGDAGKALAKIDGSAPFDGARAIELIHEVVEAELAVLRGAGSSELAHILITLETQYHVIWLLDVARPLYLYLVLDRGRTTLAAALRTLGEIQNDLASGWARAA